MSDMTALSIEEGKTLLRTFDVSLYYIDPTK